MAVGVDIEEIERFKNKPENFLNRIYTPVELEYCSKFTNPAPHLAVRFCAKEAVIKALSALNINISEYKSIEIFHNENQVPQIKLLNNTNQNIKFELSLSHDKTKAIAFVNANLI